MNNTDTLKVAYLLSDSVVALGQIGAHFQYVTRARKFSLKTKLDNLEQNYIDSNYMEGLHYIRFVKDEVKRFNNTKHPQKQLIVAYTTLERTFLKYFDEHLVNFNISLKTIQLSDMEILLEKNVLDAYAIKNSGSTLHKDNEPDINLAQGILKLLFPTENPDAEAILFLPLDFLSNDFNRLTSVPDETEITEVIPETTTGWAGITNFVKLSTLEYLSAVELKALRNQLKEDGKLCREKIGEFIKMNNECTTSITDRKKFLDTELLKEALVLETSFNKNALVNFKKVNEPANAYIYQLYTGEAPVEYFCRYFEEFEMFDELTLNYVKEQIASDEKYRKHVPFICVTKYFKNDEWADEVLSNMEQNDAPLKLRKFISVDD